MEKIGVFGGTFNPIHNGHLQVVQAAREQLGLDRILLIPTFQPPHKQAAELASPQDRLAMCRLAAAKLPYVQVSDLEIKRQGKSYTYETLGLLKEQYPDAQLHFLMGSDMFFTLQNWRRSDLIAERAVACGMAREEGQLLQLRAHAEKLQALGFSTRLLLMDPFPVSSTEIRSNIKKFNNLLHYVPKSVLEYIYARGLYGLLTSDTPEQGRG